METYPASEWVREDITQEISPSRLHRTGHTACLWQGDKLLVYGGENEHRAHLSDVIVFDIDSARWTQPELSGPTPRGRARHSAVIHDEKLFISGGMTGHDNAVLDDICYLDLKTWAWSRTWRFVPRYDHSTWVWNSKLWVSGGMTDEMERTSEIWCLDFAGAPAFDSLEEIGLPPSRYQSWTAAAAAATNTNGATGYTANSSSVQVNPQLQTAYRSPPVAPGSISSIKFVSSPHLPIQNVGYHFHVFSSGCLLDFVTPATVVHALETSLSTFDLDALRWQKLAEGKDLFSPNYRWHYCCLNQDGTDAWLLGCPNPPPPPPRNPANPDGEEYLSDVLHLDLRKLGLLGNRLTRESRAEQARLPSSDSHIPSHLSAIGADLARTFDVPPEAGSGADFVITANPDEIDYQADISDDESVSTTQPARPTTCPAVHVHRFILSARWPHFSRLYSSQMSEFHTKKMHLPEPYSAVRAFLYYLYTDSIVAGPHGGVAGESGSSSPSLEDVAGMLVMSNIYGMPRLHHLCVSRLVRELDIQHAALIFEKASIAQENWLKRRAATFCMTHWGRVVRTEGFRRLRKTAMLELCEEVDAEGRVVGGDELEVVGGLGGARLGQGGMWREGRKRGRANGSRSLDGDDGDDADEEGMEIT